MRMRSRTSPSASWRMVSAAPSAYVSPVSKKFTPRSNASRSMRTPSALSRTPHHVVPTVQTPNPTLETFRSVPRSSRNSIAVLLHALRVDGVGQAPLFVGGGQHFGGLDLAAATPEL